MINSMMKLNGNINKNVCICVCVCTHMHKISPIPRLNRYSVNSTVPLGIVENAHREVLGKLLRALISN